LKRSELVQGFIRTEPCLLFDELEKKDAAFSVQR
jgi:hypothetical protein